MVLFHGDDTTRSRSKLQSFIDEAHKLGTRIIRLDGKSLTLKDIEELLSIDSLFAEKTLCVIEGLLGLPVSTKKKELIHAVSLVSSPEKNIIFWESKTIPPTTLKLIPTAKIEKFEHPAVVFQLLDALVSAPNSTLQKKILQLLSTVLKTEPAEIVLSLLVRQLRLLITVKEAKAPPSVPPFVLQKLQRQASAFSLSTLLKLHHKILEIDLRQKTSRPGLSLDEELAQLLLLM